MNQKLQFALESLQSGVNMTELCKRFSISKPTGYKWKERFLNEGFAGLNEQSSVPKSSPNALSENTVCYLIKLKNHHPSWGPYKIRELYRDKHGWAPSDSSVKRVLERAGLVKKKSKRNSQLSGHIRNQVKATAPNDVWTVDFKGWWHTKNGERCDPLTVRDEHSRFILEVRALAQPNTQNVRQCFEKLFERHGLPGCMRSDNGSPFACSQSVLGLTKLSAWWLSLGINLERNRPGKPQDNGAHERMHRDIKRELQCHAKGTMKEQQAAFELWKSSFNHERPHQALGMKKPAQLYSNSTKKWSGTPGDIEYKNKDTRKVHKNGSIKYESKRIQISTALAGWSIGLESKEEDLLNVYFADLYIGEIDLTTLSFLGAASGSKEAPHQKTA